LIRKQQGRYHLEDIDGDDDDEEDNNANEEVVEDGGIILEDMNRFITFYRWMRIWEQQCCCCLTSVRFVVHVHGSDRAAE
jgi:hypothetical protein